MHTSFNRSRLRHTSLALFGLGSISLAAAPRLAGSLADLLAGVAGQLLTHPPLVTRVYQALVIGSWLASVLCFSAGLAFWLLSRDRRAGVLLDGKGLLLNLGHSSAFIGWANIQQVGVTIRPTSLLSFGSYHQLGITLQDLAPYIQSYEERLPATQGPFDQALRAVERWVRHGRPPIDHDLKTRLATCRRRTGFDVVIPETLLGHSAGEFALLLEALRDQTRLRANHATLRG